MNASMNSIELKLYEILTNDGNIMLIRAASYSEAVKIARGIV